MIGPYPPELASFIVSIYHPFDSLTRVTEDTETNKASLCFLRVLCDSVVKDGWVV